MLSESKDESDSRQETSDDRFKWTDARIRQLIQLVKETRHLWSNMEPGFTGNLEKRAEQFTRIAETLGTTPVEASRRFTTLRERYGKESRQYGSSSNWPFYTDLNFLDVVIKRREKRKSIKHEVKQEQVEFQHEIINSEMITEEYLEQPQEYQEPSVFTVVSKNVKRSHSPEIFVTPKLIKPDRQLEQLLNERVQEHVTPEENSVYIVESQNSEQDPIMTQQQHSQQKTGVESSIEAAFNYFRLELMKMNDKKREYCMDKMMLAFLNAKFNYNEN